MDEESGTLIVYCPERLRGHEVQATYKSQRSAWASPDSHDFSANVVEYEPGEIRAEFYDLPPARYRVASGGILGGGDYRSVDVDVRGGRTTYVDWREAPKKRGLFRL